MWKTADATELVSIHGHGDNDNNGRWRNHKGSGVPATGYLSYAAPVYGYSQ